MKNYLQRNYRTYLSIILSLIIVLFIIPIFATPGKLTNLLSKIKFPEINFGKMFTLSFPETKKKEWKPLTKYNGDIEFTKVTSEPTQIPSSIIDNNLQPFLTSTPYRLQPTAYINPTKTPKPTKAPDVFPIDPSLARPGKTTDEVFEIASQKTCVPVAVLKSIAYIESGEFFSVVSPKYFLLYNSYNWWKSQYLTDVKRACGGYDYASNTGIIPSDSNFAGQACNGGQGGDLVAMGPLSVSDYWEGKYKKPAANVLGVPQTDQRVILDAIAIVAMSVKDNVKPANCSNWTAHEVAKAACSYYGSCGFKDGTYYCNTFCRNYTKFGGKTACQTAVNQMQDNCWQ
jgi:hypothetical protein